MDFKTTSKLREGAPRNEREKHQDASDFTNIPTEDPRAALQFCQSLARMLAASPNPAINNSRQLQIVAGIKAAPCTPEYQPELSVVIPVFNEEENITVLHSRLTAVLEQIHLEYEIIFVDDGSNDDSINQLQNLSVKDKRVLVVELARNFGHQVAISAGLDFARGEAVAVMDADLQDPPEVLPEFIAKWQKGYDVIYAIRAQRKESRFKRSSYALFYRLLHRVANIDIPLDSGDFCVMDRRVVELLKSMPERSRFIRGSRSWVGLNQVGLPFERHERYAGQSKYTFGRLILLALYGLSPPGFATLVVSIFLLAGIQLITMGVIGEYVGRIFEEAKRRPLYVLRRATRNS